MDKPTAPAGSNASQFPFPEGSGSEEGFGATGVFGVVKAPEPVEGLPAGSGAEPNAQGNREAEAARPAPQLGAKVLAEPVVHRVVFGGVAAENSPELLDRIRMASAEKGPGGEKVPPTEPDVKGSSGFTELLRTLAGDAPAPAPAAREIPAAETRPPAPGSGFTSLLQMLHAQEAAFTPAEDAKKAPQPPVQFIPAEPVRAAAAPTAGGFTELLRTASAEGPEIGGAPAEHPGLKEPPATGGAAGFTPAPVENKPGTFTQMFGALEGAGAGASAPHGREGVDSSRGSAGSFTQMLSLEQPSVAADTAYREERKAPAADLDFGRPAGPAAGGAERDPFFSPPPAEAQTMESTPPVAGVGITRLIQMLDEPSKPPAPRMEEVSPSPPQGAEPGVWTRTFASLAPPNEPAAPVAKAPDWPPPQGATGFPVAREIQVPAAPPASAASGPSEFTRILDASRLREQSMRSGQIPSAETPNAPPPPPQGFAPVPIPVPAPVPVPNYPLPVPPPAAGMQGFRGMPQPGGYTPPLPPQAPVYPMNYGLQGGAIPTPGGSVPQAPGFYAPPIPAPPVPQAPPLWPVQPGAGKMQQYVPLLLVLVVVLLVALLVTVIFLMKH